jgi:hypothetical protein
MQFAILIYVIPYRPGIRGAPVSLSRPGTERTPPETEKLKAES